MSFDNTEHNNNIYMVLQVDSQNWELNNSIAKASIVLT